MELSARAPGLLLMLRSILIAALTGLAIAFAVVERVRWIGNERSVDAQIAAPVLEAPPSRRKGGPIAGAQTQPIVHSAAGTPSNAITLIVPVEGILRVQLYDTWGHARSEGRQHQGIDIMAPEGAPVRAAVDGRIVKFFDSVRGGVTIYQFDEDERFVFYYAHLLSRAPRLAENQIVRQGDVIGAVGQTGNAPVPHLHFEIQRLGPERHWWEAEAMNPYPLLVSGRAPT